MMLADAADDLDLPLAAVEQLERRQPLHHVEEVRVQPAERGPLAPCHPVGQVADQGHEQRNQRRGEQQHEPGNRVQGKDEDEKEHRHDGGQRQLGQVLAEVGIERFDALHCGIDQLAGALAARVHGAEREDVRHQPRPQAGLDPLCDPVRGHLARPGCGSAGQRSTRQQRQQPTHRGQVHPLPEHAIHDAGQRIGLQQRHCAGSDTQQQGKRESKPLVPRPTQESSIVETGAGHVYSMPWAPAGRPPGRRPHPPPAPPAGRLPGSPCCRWESRILPHGAPAR